MSAAERTVLEQLGARIQEMRVAAGLTQERAAAAAGIDWRRWQRLEEGVVNPTVRTLIRVARALGTDFWSLVGRSGKNV